MIYFIKFFYSTFLLPPGIFVLALALLSSWLFYKKQRGVDSIVAGISLLLYLSAMPLLSNILIRSLESQYKPPVQLTGDVIIMLGGGATLDTPNLHGKGHLSGDAANRLLTCLQLYHQLKVPIIVSGGQVYKTTGTEGEIAERILLDVGVPSDKIIIENKSLNTFENARNTKKIVVKRKYHHPVIVTSAFHMPRAIKQFQKVGVTGTPYPTDYLTNITEEFEIMNLIPSAEAISKSSLAMKEYLGLLTSRWY